jgi:hypothetical protein
MQRPSGMNPDKTRVIFILIYKMDVLPRDLQLEIYKKFDMDTRIKLGMIRPLKIPESIKSKLENIKRPILQSHYSGTLDGKLIYFKIAFVQLGVHTLEYEEITHSSYKNWCVLKNNKIIAYTPNSNGIMKMC